MPRRNRKSVKRRPQLPKMLPVTFTGRTPVGVQRLILATIRKEVNR